MKKKFWWQICSHKELHKSGRIHEFYVPVRLSEAVWERVKVRLGRGKWGHHRAKCPLCGKKADIKKMFLREVKDAGHDSLPL